MASEGEVSVYMGTVMGTHSQPSCLGVYDPYVQVSESISFHAFGAQWCTPILYEIIKYVNVLAFSKSFFSGVYVKLRGVCTNLLEKRGLYNLPYFRNGVPLSLMLIFQWELTLKLQLRGGFKYF